MNSHRASDQTGGARSKVITALQAPALARTLIYLAIAQCGIFDLTIGKYRNRDRQHYHPRVRITGI
jgi:hypothetical protein